MPPLWGNDYTITPDVVVTRGLENDASINAPECLVDAVVARRADLREGPNKSPLLHASISTKWTLRSDRAQNARSEALNLIRIAELEDTIEQLTADIDEMKEHVRDRGRQCSCSETSGTCEG